MVFPAKPRSGRRLWALLLVSALGCAGGEAGDENSGGDISPAQVPVGGAVTLNGKPLSHAVVTFLPPSGPSVGTGETDDEGKYTLSSMGRAGLPAGAYKVSVSYLVSADGVPQGLVARGSIVQGPGMLSAKEQLPPEYADLGRTSLAAKVPADGGTFNFDLKADVKPVEKKVAQEKPASKQEASEKSAVNTGAEEKKR